MTVKDLILKLSEFDPELVVVLNGETIDREVSSVVKSDYHNYPSEVIIA